MDVKISSKEQSAPEDSLGLCVLCVFLFSCSNPQIIHVLIAYAYLFQVACKVEKSL